MNEPSFFVESFFVEKMQELAAIYRALGLSRFMLEHRAPRLGWYLAGWMSVWAWGPERSKREAGFLPSFPDPASYDAAVCEVSKEAYNQTVLAGQARVVCKS
jgi:hypothetical protein